jgi:imidazole glycerol-phosphate synthase subunit HisH
MIALVNYGLGNIQAFEHIYSRLNLPVVIASTPSELRAATRIILPGVGSFDWAMRRLNDSGLRECLDELVLTDKVPVLGVCVGFQMMAKSSDEGVLPGLSWFDAHVKRLDTSMFTQRTHLPHMGWNDVTVVPDAGLFAGIEDPRFYFLHSYHFVPNNMAHAIATATYGVDFVAAASDRNIYGTQFHPEKSHAWGIGLLRNFATM